MNNSKARVLVVDDYQPWRQFVTSTLRKHSQFSIVGEVSDGLTAVEKARDLLPDLILLDIGLPNLMGLKLPGKSACIRSTKRFSSSAKILLPTS